MIKLGLISSISILLFGFVGNHNQPKTYFIHPTPFKSNEINTLVPEDLWAKANILNDFSSPWNDSHPQKTAFRALYNEQFLFLKYDIEDQNLLVYNHSDLNRAIGQSDRVEIFFRKNEELTPYYGLEIAPNGQIMDYKASLYRKIDQDWNWPREHLYTHGTITDNGYVMEVVIRLSFLDDLGLLRVDVLEAGIYRGDCILLPDSHQLQSQIKWITWVDPETDKPDFHIPESFGQLVFTPPN